MTFREKCQSIPNIVEVLTTEQLDALRRQLEMRDPTQRDCAIAIASIEGELAVRYVSQKANEDAASLTTMHPLFQRVHYSNQ